MDDITKLNGFYNGRLIPHGPFLQEWKDIIGFEGLYQISNYGNVKSLRNDIIISKGKNETDYLRVNLYNKPINKGFFVHRLVALYFVENPHNKGYVNHIRGFKDDLTFTQFEWLTHSENQLHSFRFLGTKVWNDGKLTPLQTSKKIVRTCLISGDEKEYSHVSATKLDGFIIHRVRHCCLNKFKNTYQGYHWKFKEQINEKSNVYKEAGYP